MGAGSNILWAWSKYYIGGLDVFGSNVILEAGSYILLELVQMFYRETKLTHIFYYFLTNT